MNCIRCGGELGTGDGGQRMCFACRNTNSAMKKLATVLVFAVVVAMSSGCFLTPVFDRIGVTEDFVTMTGKQYIKDQGYSQYINDDEIDRLIAVAKASVEFQSTMEQIAAKAASKAKIEEVIQKLLASGAFPLTAATVATNAVVSE